MSCSVFDLHMIEDLREMVAVDGNFIETLFSSYFKKSNCLIDDVKIHFGRGDMKQAVNSLVKLKSSSRVVGANHISNELSKLVEIAHGQAEIDTIHVIDRLEVSLSETHAEAVKLGFI